MAGDTVAQNVVRIQLGGHVRGSRIRGYAIVDEVDADLAAFQWYKTRDGYAKRQSIHLPNGCAYLHRLVMARVLCSGDFGELECDHISGDRLDNRRSNLRMVTHAQNMQNQKMYKTNTSGYRGVTRSPDGKKWQASVHHLGKAFYCGVHDTPEGAARAAAAKRDELGFLSRAINGPTNSVPS